MLRVEAGEVEHALEGRQDLALDVVGDVQLQLVLRHEGIRRVGSARRRRRRRRPEHEGRGADHAVAAAPDASDASDCVGGGGGDEGQRVHDVVAEHFVAPEAFQFWSVWKRMCT